MTCRTGAFDRASAVELGVELGQDLLLDRGDHEAERPRMSPAADIVRAVPTMGAIATRTPWTSSRVMPTSLAMPAFAR